MSPLFPDIRSNADLVKTFHEVFGLPVLDKPGFPPQERVDLRVELIREEFVELQMAIGQRDIVGVADALADLLYVTYGMAHEFGIPIDEVFEEVQASNMTKLDRDGKPIKREDGKILKGPDFMHPDIKRILDARQT